RDGNRQQDRAGSLSIILRPQMALRRFITRPRVRRRRLRGMPVLLPAPGRTLQRLRAGARCRLLRLIYSEDSPYTGDTKMDPNGSSRDLNNAQPDSVEDVPVAKRPYVKPA